MKRLSRLVLLFLAAGLLWNGPLHAATEAGDAESARRARLNADYAAVRALWEAKMEAWRNDDSKKREFEIRNMEYSYGQMLEYWEASREAVESLATLDGIRFCGVVATGFDAGGHGIVVADKNNVAVINVDPFALASVRAPEDLFREGVSVLVDAGVEGSVLNEAKERVWKHANRKAVTVHEYPLQDAVKKSIGTFLEGDYGFPQPKTGIGVIFDASTIFFYVKTDEGREIASVSDLFLIDAPALDEVGLAMILMLSYPRAEFVEENGKLTYENRAYPHGEAAAVPLPPLPQE